MLIMSKIFLHVMLCENQIKRHSFIHVCVRLFIFVQMWLNMPENVIIRITLNCLLDMNFIVMIKDNKFVAMFIHIYSIWIDFSIFLIFTKFEQSWTVNLNDNVYKTNKWYCIRKCRLKQCDTWQRVTKCDDRDV